MYLVGLVRLLALHKIYNRDASVEEDSDACREEIDVWEDVKREEKQKKRKELERWWDYRINDVLIDLFHYQ